MDPFQGGPAHAQPFFSERRKLQLRLAPGRMVAQPLFAFFMIQISRIEDKKDIAAPIPYTNRSWRFSHLASSLCEKGPYSQNPGKNLPGFGRWRGGVLTGTVGRSVEGRLEKNMPGGKKGERRFDRTIVPQCCWAGGQVAAGKQQWGTVDRTVLHFFLSFPKTKCIWPFGLDCLNV